MFNKTKTIEKLAKAVVEAALSLCVCECRWYSFHYHLAAKWEREANSERTSSGNLAPAAGFLSVYTLRCGGVCGGILRTQKSLGAIAVL